MFLKREIASASQPRSPEGGAWNVGALDGRHGPSWTTAEALTKTETYMTMASAALLPRL